MADLSWLGWDDGEGREKEAGSWLVAGLKPGFSFSQAELEGIKPGENTQGRTAADPRAAYTLVLSLEGWMIPAREHKGRHYSLHPERWSKPYSPAPIFKSLPFIVRVAEALPTSPL